MDTAPPSGADAEEELGSEASAPAPKYNLSAKSKDTRIILSILYY